MSFLLGFLELAQIILTQAGIAESRLARDDPLFNDVELALVFLSVLLVHSCWFSFSDEMVFKTRFTNAQL